MRGRKRRGCWARHKSGCRDFSSRACVVARAALWDAAHSARDFAPGANDGAPRAVTGRFASLDGNPPDPLVPAPPKRKSPRPARAERGLERSGPAYIIGSQRSGPVVPVGTRQTSPVPQTSSSQQGWRARRRPGIAVAHTLARRVCRGRLRPAQQPWATAPQAWQVIAATPGVPAPPPPRQRRSGLAVVARAAAAAGRAAGAHADARHRPPDRCRPGRRRQTEPGQQVSLALPQDRHIDCTPMPMATQIRF